MDRNNAMTTKEIKDIVDKAVENLLNGGLIPVADATNSLINLKEGLRKAIALQVPARTEEVEIKFKDTVESDSKEVFGS